jgi:phosphoribosylformylglycinamidine synthase
MKSAVIVFPGSNCDKDIAYVLKTFYHHKVDMVWHKTQLSQKYDLVVLPGGFSYGDYLRCGAIARFSPAMKSVLEHAKRGGRILGICNGFQILTESGLLPGTLFKNTNLKHICKNIQLVKGSQNNPLTSKLQPKQVLTIPISHGEGNYYADPDTVKQLKEENRILYRYYKENPNGSVEDIAGITSSDFKIAGLMPHPERAMENWTGTDGKLFFDNFFEF